MFLFSFFWGVTYYESHLCWVYISVPFSKFSCLTVISIFFRIFLTTNLCRCKVMFCRGLLKTNHTVDLSTWNRWESKMMAEYEHFVSVKERQYGAVVKSGGLWIHIPWVWDMPWWLLAVWPRTGVLTSLCLSFLLWKMGILIVPASVVLVVFNFFLFWLLDSTCK